MASLIRVNLYRTGVLCALIVAGCSVIGGLSLLAEIVTQRGSREGNTLLAGFGLMLLLISLLALFVSTVCSDMLKSSSKNTSLDASCRLGTREGEEWLD
jgi:hypothetical protein